MLEKLFKLSANKTTVKTELVAGLTTFMTMAYILAVNPNILSAAGIPRGGVFIATALASVVGTLLMAFLSNYPFVLAPGMGLNAFLTFGVVLGMGYSWQFALLAVFVEGLVFLALSLTPIREGIFNAIPLSLKKAVSAGIGLFICFIALQTAKVVVDSGATLVDCISFRDVPFHTQGICALLALVGTLLTGMMLAKGVKGAILFGILATWIVVQEEGYSVCAPAVYVFHGPTSTPVAGNAHAVAVVGVVAVVGDVRADLHAAIRRIAAGRHVEHPSAARAHRNVLDSRLGEFKAGSVHRDRHVPCAWLKERQ